jgi:hypothetical protein
MTLGWINFVCENCKNEVKSRAIPIADSEEYFNDSENYFKTHKI